MWIFFVEAAVALALLGAIVWASWPSPDRPRRPLRAPPPESPSDATENPAQEASDESGKP